MPNSKCNPINLRNIIKKFEHHLESQDLIISLLDGTCHIERKEAHKDYQVFVDKADVSVSITVEAFLR